MSEKQLKFKALGDIETKSLEGDNEETLVIEGIISTTNKDLYGDILTQEALESLKNQMIGLNVFLDHEYGYDDVVGVVRDARLEDNKLYGTVAVTEDYAEDIKSKLNFGVNLGFSIGGTAERKENDMSIITDFNLIEISLTPLPANLDSFGTVEAKGVTVGTCLTGICHKMLKNIESETMSDTQPNNQENEIITEETVRKIINEAIAEKEETFKAEIVDEINTQIDKTVEAKIKELSTQEGESGEDPEPQNDEEEDKTTDTKNTEVDDEEDKEDKDSTQTVETKSLDVDSIAEAVFKRIKELETSEQENKLKQFLDSKNMENNNTFLNSDTRDELGRNKKFL